MRTQGGGRVTVRGAGSGPRLIFDRLFLFFLAYMRYEFRADLIAVDPCQFAAAIGEAGGGQQQEEFLEMQPLD